jgi:ABC-type sugar transport system substrate-binding protein
VNRRRFLLTSLAVALAAPLAAAAKHRRRFTASAISVPELDRGFRQRLDAFRQEPAGARPVYFLNSDSRTLTDRYCARLKRKPILLAAKTPEP